MIFSSASLNPVPVSDDPDTFPSASESIFFPTTSALYPFANSSCFLIEIACSANPLKVASVTMSFSSATEIVTRSIPAGDLYVPVAEYVPFLYSYPATVLIATTAEVDAVDSSRVTIGVSSFLSLILLLIAKAVTLAATPKNTKKPITDFVFDCEVGSIIVIIRISNVFVYILILVEYTIHMQTTTQTTKIIIGTLIAAILIGLGVYMNQKSDSMIDDVDSVATTTVGTSTANKETISGNSSTKKGVTIVTPQKNPLAGTSWIWKDTLFMNKSTSSVPAANEFIITFGTDGAMTSTTDCNSISGKYVVYNNKITITNGASTMMACQGQTREAEYVTQLSQVTNFTLQDLNELDLSIGNTATMSFTRR